MCKKIKCNTREEIEKFLLLHKDCNMNSDSYDDGIELVYCKTHSICDDSSRYRKPGTYVFIDTKVIKL